MKIFNSKVILFILIFFSYSAIMYFINHYIYINQIPSDSNVNLIILGDSHPQTAIDPEEFPDAINNAQRAEPYYITYWKFKNYIKRNTVDTVLLGFSYHNFSSFNDKKLSDQFWSNEMYSRIYPFTDLGDLNRLDIDVDMTTFLRTKIINMSLYPKNHKSYIGKFDPEPAVTNLSDVKGVIDRHFYVNDEIAKVSNTSIQYLDSIIYTCETNGIVTILVSNPMHQSYLNQIPAVFVQNYTTLKYSYERRGVLVLDHSNEPYEDNYFFNPDHLNIRGAKIFTKEISRELYSK